MRKKIFAIVLALCMLLTMMPSMGFAETTTSPEQLYVAWLAEGDAPSDDGKITQAKLQQNGAGCGDAMYIPIGQSDWNQFFCYKDENDDFVILDVITEDTDANISSDKLEIRKVDGGYVADFTEKVNCDDEGDITVTAGSKTYQMKWHAVLPGIGAYKSTTFNDDTLIWGSNFKYKDLPESSSTDSKTVYFAVDTDQKQEVVSIELENGYNNEVFTATPQKALRYLEVEVKDTVDFEEIHILATIKTTHEDNSIEESTRDGYFSFEGNLLRGVRYDENDPDTHYDAGKIVNTENVDSFTDITITPRNDNYCYFALPTANSNEYKIVTVTEWDDDINVELAENSKAAYKISPKADAVLGEQYCVYANDEQNNKYMSNILQPWLSANQQNPFLVETYFTVLKIRREARFGTAVYLCAHAFGNFILNILRCFSEVKPTLKILLY